METQIQAMLALQDEINEHIHPHWRGQGYPWYRAIWVECAELLDHYGWKWWKHQAPDLEQVQLELVDIWHFGLSDLLTRAVPPAQIAAALQPVPAVPAAAGAEAFRDAVEHFAANTLGARNFDLPGFAALMHAAGLDFDRLYRSYVGKNVLNRFRQDRGYRQGTYRKRWGDREDNEWLVILSARLDPGSETFAAELYAALGACYETVPDG